RSSKVRFPRPSLSDDRPYAALPCRGGAPASVLLWGAGMTIPTWLRGTITVVAAALSLTLLAPRESFAQG
ncbi:MAG TPA: hypothetical protein VEQ84_06575, partial [Vicinamibacteria bacterium]|nr:hypothetical protein [Vicinamibacteria bacterium]